jgi:hypothetical protein
VQFSFDVYWEADAQHRFTRQECSEHLADAPVAGSEIGKTGWEVPHLAPGEEAWREHRATLEAHLPFRDFGLARPTPDGGNSTCGGSRNVGGHGSARGPLPHPARARHAARSIAGESTGVAGCRRPDALRVP